MLPVFDSGYAFRDGLDSVIDNLVEGTEQLADGRVATGFLEVPDMEGFVNQITDDVGDRVIFGNESHDLLVTVFRESCEPRLSGGALAFVNE